MEGPTLFLFVLLQIVVLGLCGFTLAQLCCAVSHNKAPVSKIAIGVPLAAGIVLITSYITLIASLLLK